MALIENIQREDLNPLEEAQGVKRLIEEFGLTHEQAATAIGRSRSATSNLLRLLNLATPVQTMLLAGDIDMGHARALLAVDAAIQIQLANQIIAKRLSVRDAEALVTRTTKEPTNKLKPATHKEVIIMIGYPASGKSTIAQTVFPSYYTVSGDVHKTAKAMLKDAEKHVITNSILFDSTAGTKAKRHEFLLFAQKHNLPTRAIWVTTSIDEAMERNKQRAAETKSAKIPDVAFYIYRKNFETPTEAEGFKLVVV
jgi:ParB-like chromosome segregation protein Spo0J